MVTSKCKPVNRGKFATLHGQKKVATILDTNVIRTINGCVADMIIGTSLKIKRETTSQLLEAIYNIYIA